MDRLKCPPPLRLLTYETGHFICSQKRTLSLANDSRWLRSPATLRRMVCLKLADIEREYEVAMRQMDDASPRLDDASLTDRSIRVIAARKAWIEHCQTCIFCKGVTKDQST